MKFNKKIKYKEEKGEENGFGGYLKGICDWNINLDFNGCFACIHNI
jgi:hypothetical protein